mgnify:CR=1 FL=1
MIILTVLIGILPSKFFPHIIKKNPKIITRITIDFQLNEFPKWEKIGNWYLNVNTEFIIYIIV